MATVLERIQKEYDEKILLNAIENGNKPIIVEYLKKLADNITPEIANKLAYYLDENRRGIKPGPKPKKERLFVERLVVITVYQHLCENRELARFLFNRDRESFAIVEGSEIFDAEGEFSPQWKYPHRERNRNLVKLPQMGEIKTEVCKMYNIKSRTFDDLHAVYAK